MAYILHVIRKEVSPVVAYGLVRLAYMMLVVCSPISINFLQSSLQTSNYYPIGSLNSAARL